VEKKKALGFRGSWFADVDGETLPCVHQHWWAPGGRYDDPGLQPGMPKGDELVASIAAEIRRRAPSAERVVFETGPLSVWFYHSLSAEGLPAICIDARHAKAALDMAANKTDANDADGLAHLAEVGFFREVRVS
jgi:hypothetical protein